jgi:ADP-ribose pyrophosphatase
MEILKTERRTRERWLNLFARTWRHNGGEGEWLFASRKDDPPLPATGIDAVIIVAVVRAPSQPPRLVVLKEFRVPVGDYVYAFPAGLTEEGEGLEDVARRELREETGLEVVEVKRVSPTLYSSAGLTDEAVALAFVTAEARAGGVQALDHSEDIEVLLLDYQQVCDLCNADVRVDAKAWTVLYLYQLLGALV